MLFSRVIENINFEKTNRPGTEIKTTRKYLVIRLLIGLGYWICLLLVKYHSNIYKYISPKNGLSLLING